MTGIQRLPAVCAFIVLMVIAPARGHQFSDWSTPVNLGPVVNSSFGDFFAALPFFLLIVSPRLGLQPSPRSAAWVGA